MNRHPLLRHAAAWRSRHSTPTPPSPGRHHELVRLTDHSKVRTLSGEPQPPADKDAGTLFRVDIGDGAQLDGWIIKPPVFRSDEALSGASMSTAAGGADGPRRSATGRESASPAGADRLIVISVDNHGTPAARVGTGAVIYRRMGVLEPQDQAAAARVIARWPYVDPTPSASGLEREGTATLNVLFRYPDLYRMGMSVAPVPDIATTTRLPGALLRAAAGASRRVPAGIADHVRRPAQGQLLIVHGTGDDNVRRSGHGALINALVAADKPFTMMAYRNRSHGIYEGPGTTQHLFHLLERFLTENLPPGPRTP